MTFDRARQACAYLGSEMVSIGSAAEDQVVFGLLTAQTRAAWIGLRRQQGVFVWVDGSAVGYTHWAPGEPNNERGQEDCVLIWGPSIENNPLRSRWNDAPCAKPPRDAVVCERAP
jgi:hypothetical protein